MARNIANIEINKDQSRIQQIKIEHRILNDHKELSDEFNRYYAEIGPSIAAQRDQITETRQTKQTPHNFFLNSVNVSEIKQYIQELKNNKSPGIDEIKSDILKESQ